MKTKFVRLLTAVVALFVSTAIFAQDEEVVPNPKPTVFFEKAPSGSSTQHKTVRNAIVSAIISTNHIIALDAESEEISSNEDIRRTNDNVTSGQDMVSDRLGAVVRLGAQYYLKIAVDNVSTTSKDNTASCQITFTLKIIDPSESKIITTRQMAISGTGADNSYDKAFDNALSTCKSENWLSKNPIFRFVEEFFPIKGQILEIDTSKKDKAQTVYINAGSDHGVNKNTKFEVFKEKKIGTRIASIKIGELEAKEVQAGDLTLCKVEDGAEEIFKLFNEGTVLKIQSRPKKENTVVKRFTIGG